MLVRYRKRLDELGVRAEVGFIYDGQTIFSFPVELVSYPPDFAIQTKN